jgi:phospholipid-binding lipoprotein MlaA
MPEFARASFDRAFRNLGFPQRFVSSLLQLKFRKAGTELGRFVVNSSLGVGGLWDPAERCLKWHSSEEDLGQALGYYGVGDGLPIVLPLLGQSNLRDLFAMAPATYVYPLTYVADFQTLLEVRTGEEFNRASLNLDAYDVIKKDALDPYTYIRDAYKQMREKKIKE